MTQPSLSSLWLVAFSGSRRCLQHLPQPCDPHSRCKECALSKSCCPSTTVEADLRKTLKDVWSSSSPFLLEICLLSNITISLGKHLCFFLADLEGLFLLSDPLFKHFLSDHLVFCHPRQNRDRASDHSLSLHSLFAVWDSTCGLFKRATVFYNYFDFKTLAWKCEEKIKFSFLSNTVDPEDCFTVADRMKNPLTTLHKPRLPL